MKNAVIGVLATLVILMGGYLVYDKVISKEETKENNSTEETKKESVSEDYDVVKAKALVDKYLTGTYNRASHENSLLSDQIDIDKYKLFFAIKNATPTEINYTCEEAFPEYKDQQQYENQYIVKSNDFWGSCEDSNPNNPRKQYTYDSVNQSYKKLFGNDGSASKTNISFSTTPFAYSEKYNAYIELSCECGGIDFIQEIFGVKSAKLNGDKLIVNIGYSTYEPEGDDPANYSTAILNTINGEVKISKEEANNEEALLNKYLDKFDTYEFEFFKEDDTYKLKNVTKK